MKNPNFEFQSEEEIIPTSTLKDNYTGYFYTEKKTQKLPVLKEEIIKINNSEKRIITLSSKVRPPYTEEDDF